MTDVSTRNRVSKGVSTGGQFITEAKPEAAEVSLAAPATDLDSIALSQMGQIARDWCREDLRVTKAWAISSLSAPKDQEKFKAASERMALAERFETLDRSEAAQLVGDRLAELAEPGQKFGTETVQLAEGFEYDEGTVLLGLAAQQKIDRTQMPGETTFVSALKGKARFEVREEGITHEVVLSERSVAFDHHLTDAESQEEGSDAWEWRWRSHYLSTGGVLQGRFSKDHFDASFKDYRAIALVHQEMGASKLAGCHEVMSDLGLEGRSVTLSSDGLEYVLDLNGDTPALMTDSGDGLHPSMADGFLDHFANSQNLSGRDELISELRGVFDRAKARLG